MCLWLVIPSLVLSLNSFQGLNSTIPMESTSWKIAEANNVSDWEVCSLLVTVSRLNSFQCNITIHSVLACSLANAMMSELWLKGHRVIVTDMDARTKEQCKNSSFYCEDCKVRMNREEKEGKKSIAARAILSLLHG